MIQASDIHFHYPRTHFELVVDSLRIETGEKVAFVGASGSGKTTLVSLLAGIFLPQKGKVCFFDHTLTEMTDSQRRKLRLEKMGFIFQEFELVEYLRTLDNILLPYQLNSSFVLNRMVRERAHRLMDEMGLGDKLKNFPGELSQGEKQRVAIGRALIHEPTVLIADEPTGNLDPVATKDILKLLFTYLKSQKASLLMITHDHSLLTYFDRVIDLQDFGREKR